MDEYLKVDSMSNYREQIVKRKMTPTKLATIVMSLVACLLVMAISVYLSQFFGWFVPIALLMLGLGIYLIFYIIKNSGIEFEYTFVMGELRIDKIKGKSKRKRMTVFDVKSIDKLDRYIDRETGRPAVSSSKYDHVIRACQDEHSEDTYYVVIHDKVKQKPALLLFSPDERTMNMIKPYFSTNLKKKFFAMEKEDKQRLEKAKKSEKPDEKKDK